MARKPSMIMNASEQRERVRDLRAEVKEARSAATNAKKAVTEAMKRFLTDPTNGEHVKEYRAAVSEHIKTVKAVSKLQRKLP